MFDWLKRRLGGMGDKPLKDYTPEELAEMDPDNFVAVQIEEMSRQRLDETLHSGENQTLNILGKLGARFFKGVAYLPREKYHQALRNRGNDGKKMEELGASWKFPRIHNPEPIADMAAQEIADRKRKLNIYESKYAEYDRIKYDSTKTREIEALKQEINDLAEETNIRPSQVEARIEAAWRAEKNKKLRGKFMAYAAFVGIGLLLVNTNFKGAMAGLGKASERDFYENVPKNAAGKNSELKDGFMKVVALSAGYFDVFYKRNKKGTKVEIFCKTPDGVVTKPMKIKLMGNQKVLIDNDGYNSTLVDKEIWDIPAQKGELEEHTVIFNAVAVKRGSRALSGPIVRCMCVSKRSPTGEGAVEGLVIK